ncbi:MAG: bifunctional DNA primase/polymerase [Chloroflexota bacterium]
MPNSNLSSTIFTAAEAYFSLGYSVIPLLGDKSPDRPKAAAVPWSAYQGAKPTLAQLRGWFLDDQFPALAIITGTISRLAVLDFDTPEMFRTFKSRFPALADTQVVQTRRGFHIYFRLPVNMRVPSRKGQGIDWLSDGCYVVARPSTIAGHTYKLVKGGQPHLLSIPDLHNILSFIEEQSPVASCQLPAQTETPNLSPQHFSLSASYRYHAAKGAGRNRALFIASLTARDHGWPLEQTLETLVDLHINQRTSSTHPQESPEIRRQEAEKTVRSAYSRPARIRKIVQNPQKKSDGLPNTVREQLFQRKSTHAVRLWEGLNTKGIHPGGIFTAAQAIVALKGVVGRDSIYNALNLILNGAALFEGQSPSGHPQASSDAAVDTKTKRPKKCVFGRAEKSGIIQKGRKTRRFIMPAPLDWCRILGVDPAHSDPLGMDDLTSAKQTRMAAHRELIKRRPGKYPRRWLAKRLGVRVETIDTYNQEIPIHRLEQFIEKRIYWSNIRLVPDDTMQIDGAFLEDSRGKRYPAKRSIAAKLLGQGQSLTYKRQDANYYWYGDDCPDLGVLYGQAPAQYLHNRLHYAEQGRANIPTYPTHQNTESITAIGLQKPDSVGTQHASSALKTADMANIATHSPSMLIEGARVRGCDPKPPKPKRLPSGRRPLKNADHEALACRVVERVNRLSADPALHIGLAVVRRLVSQYDRVLIDRTLALLDARRNVAKPAGFFITVLRSESKRSLLGGG